MIRFLLGYALGFVTAAAAAVAVVVAQASGSRHEAAAIQARKEHQP